MLLTTVTYLDPAGEHAHQELQYRASTQALLWEKNILLDVMMFPTVAKLVSSGYFQPDARIHIELPSISRISHIKDGRRILSSDSTVIPLLKSCDGTYVFLGLPEILLMM